MKQANNDLKVVIKAKEMAVHTIKITSNCNKFPKKYRFTLCDRMQNKSMNIYEFLLEANRTHLSNIEPRERSKTFPGIAQAMAEQWGRLLNENHN